jgi:hypothetical protein
LSAEPLHSLSSPFGDLRQICRRICLLRLSGKKQEAAELEQGELARALAAMHEHGADVDPATVFASEQARVEEARDLAELLAPMLLQGLQSSLALVSAASTEATATVVPFSPAPRASSSASAAAGATAPSIADFIDGMLAQDAAVRRPAPSGPFHSTPASTASSH